MDRIDKKETTALGFWFAWGCVKLLGTVWWAATMAVMALALLLCALGYPATDSTDVSRWDRSGMRLRTDHLTGCQYLESAGGALTPRMDRAGLPMCGGRG